jgi:beta-lactamase regulating signal transducer with metallopeptidase domain/tetratricopeptide (TPR) repeat protein
MIMTPIFSLSSVLDSITPESLAWWLSRVTLVAVLACAYLTVARRARPATRHLVAVGALVSIALLPLASALLPSWPLPVLPSVQATDMSGGSREVTSAIDPSPSEFEPARAVQPVDTESRVATAGRVSSAPARESAGFSVDWTRVGLLAWFAVTIALLVRIGAATFIARRFTRRTPATTDEILVRECERARRVLGIERAIDVHVSAEVAIPMVVGVVHPRVILPAAAMVWSRERLSVVLLHELAHVRRRDALWLRVARVVTAVFWFHPLVWVLSRHVCRDAERACDDVVLACGVRGSDYAGHLIAIARTVMARDPLSGSALAFATRSSLERRVVSILHTQSRRATVSARMLAAVAAGALALLVVIAAARPTAVVSAQIAPEDAYLPLGEYPSSDAIEQSHPRRAALEPGFTFAIATADGEKEHADQKYYLADDRDERSGGEWYGRASDLYHRERYVQAAEAYEHAAERGYRRETALYNAGCSYALAGKTDPAIEALRASFEEGFDRPELFAADDDLNSLRADPRFRKLLDEVMSSGSASASRRAASREFERLAKRKDVDEGDWNSVGMDLLRSGDYEHAAQAFNNEFKVSKDEDALYNMACARALDGKTAEALTLLDQSIKTGSVDADHMEEDPDLITLHKEKRFDELVALAEDLTLNQGWINNDVWGNVNEEKRWRKSIPRLESVTREHPDIGRAWFNLGYAQLAAEEGDMGTASFKKALDLGYRAPTTMYNLACSTAQAGEIDASFAWLEKAEGAGMHMWSQARWDDDLDPLRSDPRYKKLAKRWKAEERTWHEEQHKDKYDYEYNSDDDDDKDDTTN